MSEAGSEGPWALPEGWYWARLGEIADVIAGQSPPSETYNDSGVGLPFFQGKTEFGALYPTVRKWCATPTKIAEPRDILISVRAPVGPTNVARERSGIGRGLAAVRSRPIVEPNWLLFFLRFSEQQLASLGTGTTFAAITGDVLRDHALPLAPLTEQRRIVARIDALFAEIAEGEAALAEARKGLEIFRRALLKAAVSGELTKEWREANAHPETGVDFLARIASDGVAGAKSKGRGRRNSKSRAFDASTLTAVPDGWAWAEL